MDSSITHIRPRFKLEVAIDQHELFRRVSQVLEHPSKRVQGRRIEEHVVLDIVGEDVHFWTPRLSFRIEPDEENPEHSVVSGLIGPRPTVWTMFVFIYFGVGTAGLILSMYGGSKWMLGHYSPLVWALPIAILFMLTAYSAGKYGERLSAEQIEELKEVVRKVVRAKE
jgi:hypothetical protein